MPNFPYRCFCLTVSLNIWNKSDSDQYNSLSERSHIIYTWMLFPIYQHVIYLWVFPSAVVQECVDQFGFGFGKNLLPKHHYHYLFHVSSHFQYLLYVTTHKNLLTKFSCGSLGPDQVPAHVPLRSCPLVSLLLSSPGGIYI